MLGPGRCTGLGFSFVSCGSVEHRAWFSAFVLGSDALRGVLDRHSVKRIRIRGVHLSDLLHTTYLQFSSVLTRI